MRLRWWSFLLVLVLGVSLSGAQEFCNSIIDQTLEAVGDNCDELNRNSACYGYNRVEASFLVEVPEDFFTIPADVTSILELRTITTAGLDAVLDLWGVAIMNLQANVPNTLPGQNVTFILLGDAEVENAVEPGSAFTPSDGITVSARSNANLRSGPGLNYNVVGGVAAGASLSADGVSEDGAWLRVVANERLAWIARSVLATNAAIDELPALTAGLRTPMQAFYLRTGIGAPDCSGAPDDTLLIQGPENIKVDLTVNGADIRVGSTVLIYLIAENVMEIFVIDGEVVIPPSEFNPRGLTIREGYRSRVCLSEPDDRGLNNEPDDRVVSCEWSDPELATPPDVDPWCVLENVPSNLLNYPIDLPCGQEVVTEESFGSGRPQQPTVFLQGGQGGNTLPEEEDEEIVTPGGGTTGGGGDTPPPVVDCSGFALLSPKGGAPINLTVYDWSEAPGATLYVVNFFNEYGVPTAQYPVNAPTTEITLNTGEVPTGSIFYWEVHAYKDGQFYCNTGGDLLTRFVPPELIGIPPARPQSASTFKANRECDGATFAVVNWSGAKPSDTITITGEDACEFIDAMGGTGASGSGYIAAECEILSIRVSTSSGDVVNLPGCEYEGGE